MSFKSYSRLLMHTQMSAAANKSQPQQNGGILSVLAAEKNMQQRRALHPVCGPPRFPMSPAKRFLLGWGSLAIMMIIPFWGLFSLPAWAEDHRTGGVPEEDDEEEDEE